MDFSIPVGRVGDCFDRYLMRIYEMRESLLIIEQCLDNISYGLIGVGNSKIFPPAKAKMRYFMESLIHHFKLYSECILLPQKEIYYSVEAPKGEFGVYISSNGGNRLNRCKIRSPGFYHLQGLNFMAEGHMLADMVAIIGTQDLVFGEIDR